MTIRKAMYALATAALLAPAGCSSTAHTEQSVDDQTDLADQNRLLVRMALAENVYNATAVEHAIYPKDFAPGSAKLSELGTQRVRMLIAAYTGGSGSITIVKGDETDELYDARITAIRQQLADAGLEQVCVAKGGRVGGDGVRSDRAVLTYKRVLSDYAVKPGSSSQSGGSNGSQATSDTNQKGQ